MGPNASEAARFASEHGVARSTNSIQDVVDADDVDAVVVASPSAEHSRQAIAALHAGKHVLCEIPVGLSLAEVTAVADASGRLTAMACHTQRHFSALSALRERAASSEFEPISMATIAAIYRRVNVGLSGEPRDWVDDIVWHHTAHAVDTTCWLLGEDIAELRALAAPVAAEVGRPLDVSVSLRTKTGRLATIAVSYNATQPVSELMVFGRSEIVRISNWQTMPAPAAEPNALLGEAVRAQTRAFLEAIANGLPGHPSIAEVMPTYRVIQQVHDLIQAEVP
jgi:2-hydroxy-4-carboxymuconate semialdehyde hemiacetal dehydrogenase